VLARLDAIPCVKESRVDASGRWFLLSLAPGADAAGVVAGAQAVLRGCGRRLEDAEAATQLAARVRGDPWFAAGEVHALSYVEARLLSVRIADGAAAALALDPGAREAVAEAARAELFRAVERVHAEGGRESTGWFYEAWPQLAAAIAERARPDVPAEARERLAETLAGLHARR
jgi:hypothetical protein